MMNPAETQRMNESEIVDLAQQGCRDSLELLLRTHHRELRGFLVRRVGDLSVADDLAQDVFLAALHQFQKSPPDSGFRAWLFAVARNKVVDHLRRMSREHRHHVAEVESLVMLHNVSPENHHQAVDEERLSQSLQDCIDKLNPKAKSLITAYYFDNLSTEKIAINENRKGSAIRMAMMRVRQALARCIRREMGSEISL